MNITRLLWDKGRLDHIEGDNGVPREEVEGICFGKHIVEKQETDVFRLFGHTSSGRLLCVIVRRIQDTAFRPITAYIMNDTQKHAYRKKIKGKK